MGKSEEEDNYNKRLSSSNRALSELQDAFRGSQFEGELKPTVQRFNSPPAITNAINRNLNKKDDLTQLLFGRKNGIKDKIIEGVQDFFIPPVFNPKDHKKVWALGADTYLTMKGYLSSAWLLKHSLEDKPKDVYRDNNSRIAQLIKNDSVFLDRLDKAIAESNGKTLDTTLKDVAFESGDLYYSIHKGKIKVTGKKGNDGKWKISARLTDDYDFTEIMSFMNEKNK